MCEWCAAPAGVLDGFSVVERPAQKLVGRIWEGTHSQAEAGAVRAVLKDVQAFAGGGEGASALWAGPIVCLSWNERADGFRTFVGVEADGRKLARGMTRLDQPAMRFATAWHEPAKISGETAAGRSGDGEVVDRYQAMLGWIEREGLSWDRRVLHHREEYPLHADFSAPPVLRLMVPVR